MKSLIELHGDKHPHITPALAAHDSFGHTGSTGCVAWYGPGQGCRLVRAEHVNLRKMVA